MMFINCGLLDTPLSAIFTYLNANSFYKSYRAFLYRLYLVTSVSNDIIWDVRRPATCLL